MNKEFADLWVADLRDPNNKQCRGALHDGEGHCCLGRAAIVGGMRFVPGFTKTQTGAIYEVVGEFVIDGTQFNEGIGGVTSTLSGDVADNLGFKDSKGSINGLRIKIGNREYRSLAEANDRGVTFLEIADWVEKNWELL